LPDLPALPALPDLPALPGAAAFGLRAVLDLTTALLPSFILLFEIFRFTGTTLSGSWNNNGYPG
jgi:hypothetical protein